MTASHIPISRWGYGTADFYQLTRHEVSGKMLALSSDSFEIYGRYFLKISTATHSEEIHKRARGLHDLFLKFV